MMSKRDFEAMARVLREERMKSDCIEVQAALTSVAKGLAEVAKSQNPWFDEKKFWDAVGLQRPPGGPQHRPIPRQR